MPDQPIASPYPTHSPPTPTQLTALSRLRVLRLVGALSNPADLRLLARLPMTELQLAYCYSIPACVSQLTRVSSGGAPQAAGSLSDGRGHKVLLALRSTECRRLHPSVPATAGSAGAG